MKKKVVYPNLAAEMARKKITQSKLGELLGINRVIVHQRLIGATDWKLKEICFIMNYFNEGFEYLFEIEKRKED